MAYPDLKHLCLFLWWVHSSSPKTRHKVSEWSTLQFPRSQSSVCAPVSFSSVLFFLSSVLRFLLPLAHWHRSETSRSRFWHVVYNPAIQFTVYSPLITARCHPATPMVYQEHGRLFIMAFRIPRDLAPNYVWSFISLVPFSYTLCNPNVNYPLWPARRISLSASASFTWKAPHPSSWCSPALVVNLQIVFAWNEFGLLPGD